MTAGQLFKGIEPSLPRPCHQYGVIDTATHWYHPLGPLLPAPARTCPPCRSDRSRLKAPRRVAAETARPLRSAVGVDLEAVHPGPSHREQSRGGAAIQAMRTPS